MTSPRNMEHVDYSSPLVNMCFTAAGLAIGAGGAATWKTTASLLYTIDNIFYTKAAIAATSLLAALYNPSTSLAFSAADATIPAGQTGYFAFCIDAAGTVRVIPGIRKNSSDVFAYSGESPDFPLKMAQFGLLKIVTTTAPFVPGTTALDAAGLTVTFRDTAGGQMERKP